MYRAVCIRRRPSSRSRVSESMKCAKPKVCDEDTLSYAEVTPSCTCAKRAHDSMASYGVEDTGVQEELGLKELKHDTKEQATLLPICLLSTPQISRVLIKCLNSEVSFFFSFPSAVHCHLQCEQHSSLPTEQGFTCSTDFFLGSCPHHS